MGVKESIAQSYIEDWHERTKGWTAPHLRRALVVGSNAFLTTEVANPNIGCLVAKELRTHRPFVRVTERNIDSFDLADKASYQSHSGLDAYDTLVLANGETNLDWIENQSLDKIQDVVENKLLGSMFAVQHFAKLHISKETPYIKNIVLIGSMAHRSVLNASAPYCAACAGLVHFGRCVAWELAPKGFRVFIVNPSNVENTPMTETTIQGIMDYRGVERDQAEEYWAATRALPEWLTAADIATVVRILVTEPAMRWLSGVPLDLGGGLR